MPSSPRRASKRVGKTQKRPCVLPVEIHRQPTDESCGPTCLHAVYRYWGLNTPIRAVLESVRTLAHDDVGRGTLAVNLGVDALRRGFVATLYTFNLNVFDPSWFSEDGRSRTDRLSEKLSFQAGLKARDKPKRRVETDSYLEFLRLGGRIRFQDLTSRLISGHIRAGRPLLIGLSATYLYRAVREYGPTDIEDDVRGVPQGHFVLLHGYDPRSRVVHIADPLEDNPRYASRNYTVPMARLVPAIMLGVLTYDGNLLAIEPGSQRGAGASGGKKNP